MANPGYVTITGKAQGLISAGCSSKESIGNKYQSAHTDEIMMLSYTRNLANFENNNSSTHGPIIISKYIDKSSPLLEQALTRREELDCTFDFYQTTPSGTQEKFYSISIKGGLIVDLTQDMPDVIFQSDGEMREHVAFRFREINYTNLRAATSGYGFWGEPR
ncbi:Hcp family type VI secretion system effector [Pseudomonas sp. CCI3.2]|uniref:Hcp family type VI secretion system effector n=3 Tax=Pseudomonas TaxID=286 RepID=UPI002AC9DA03|nr:MULTISPECIES: Hcp family type VI secretion system effector [unclassified Pseudomonas]MEB0076333.1 Hcp family type VI secretion system effector [Pseudomonas sp. MH10out]MEB0079206.1 Hcp family type VI secretion system effector [Pseudomonas sp. MH10out]MEB0090510.1 Hcp family type VI secretion system effector [Pseudomonas sp. CCI4.2]MEB0101028.1 Hcp family type VI secretion system effector [Pseudomonas sp. CCI3.2]MEB0128887.1 Hcp family type VI secretion system effector [Pseudomonas sp. CCI2.